MSNQARPILFQHLCTLKHGVGSIPNHHRIQAADDEATATDVTSVEKILVNTALSGESTCLEIGWCKANFDDAGGAAEDLWAIQTGIGDINLGARPRIAQFFTPTGLWTSNVTYTGFWTRDGAMLNQVSLVVLSGAPNAAALTFNVPAGLVINSAKLLTGGTFQVLGEATIHDDGTNNFMGKVQFSTTTAVTVHNFDDAGALETLTGVSASGPFTWAANDDCWIKMDPIPIVNWD